MSVEILPDSRLKSVFTTKGAVMVAGNWWQPIYCANCHVRGGLVPEEHCTFAFWLCNACAETHGAIANTYTEPDAVFWQRVNDMQVETYGRVLSPREQAAELDTVDSPLSRLSRQRQLLTPKAGD